MGSFTRANSSRELRTVTEKSTGLLETNTKESSSRTGSKAKVRS
jgi:hypothetical protein